MAKVYVSFGSSDRDNARRLILRLSTAGHSDESQIDLADVVLVLISPEAGESIRVTNEMSRTLALRKPLIPIIVKETPLPAELGRLQFIDATRDWDDAMRQLELALSAIVPTSGEPVLSFQAPSPSVMPRQKQSPVQPSPARPEYYPASAAQAAPRGNTRLVVVAVSVVVILILALLGISLLGNQGTQVGFSQTATVIAATNYGVATALRATEIAQTWTLTPSYTPNPTDTPQIAITESALPTVRAIALPVEIQTVIAEDVEATVGARTPVVVVATYTPSATLSLGEQVQGTIVALRATDTNSLSPKEAAQLIAQAIQQTQGSSGSANNNLLIYAIIFALGFIVAGAGIRALIGLTRSSAGGEVRVTIPGQAISSETMAGQDVLEQTAHPVVDAAVTSTPLVVQSTKPEPLLQEYEVFISSSDRDRAWVGALVKDLTTKGHLVWWYAKDAPGLPFGQEIKSAIFYTKVFLVVLSPDSMRSKHIEEEIRWAEQFSRPIIPVLCRAVPVEDRLYGLGKAADIDFTDQQRFGESMDLLLQAIRHYLRKRLQDAQGKPSEADKPTRREKD